MSTEYQIRLLIVPSELGRLLGCSRERVRQLIAAGQIPRPRKYDGRRPAYLLDDAMEIVQQRRAADKARNMPKHVHVHVG